MVNYACAFSQSESGKYFEWIIMEFNWREGHLFGGLRNRLVLNTHALRIWVVHLLVYSAPSLQVEHCLVFAGEHLTEYIYIYIYILAWLRCTTCVGHLGWLFKLNTDEALKAETVLSAVRYSSLALQSFCFHVQIEHSTRMSHSR